VRGRPAQIGRRVLAYVIDGAIAGVIFGIAAVVFVGISFATGGRFSPLVAMGLAYLVVFAWLFVYTFMQGGSGSIGMRLLGLELVHDDGDRLGFGHALGRNIVWAAGSAIVVGPFTPLFDQSPWHRGWHDKFAGAVMTDVRGVPGFEAPPAVPLASPAPPAMPLASPAPPARSLASSAPPPMPQPAAPLVQPAPPAPPLIPQPAAAPASIPAPPFDPSSPDTPSATVVAPPRAPQQPADGPIAFVPGVTASRPPVQPQPPTIAPADVPVDETRLSTGARAFATLVWDDGARHAIYGRTLFGRNPTPETGAHVAPIRDETLSLSKTHFEIGQNDGRVWIADRHSTNGVVVRRGAQTQAAAPGQRVTVYAGDVLEIGDRRITIEVGR